MRQAHPLAPVISTNAHSRKIKIFVDLRSVVGHGTGFILAAARKGGIEGVRCRGSLVTVEEGQQALKLDTRDDFVPAEILPITVEVSRSYSHVHERIVGIYTLDAVSTVAVLFDSGEASTGDVGVSDYGFEGSLLPIDAGSGKVVFEAVPENLEQFTRPSVAYRLVAEHSFKLHGGTHILWGGNDAKDGMRCEEDASLIGHGTLNLRHDDRNGNVL